MRRRLAIKKRLQRRRLSALRITKQAAGASKSGTYKFCLISAGLTDPFMG